MAERRPVIAVPARFSHSASALRFAAEVAAAKLVRAVYDAGGEPVVLHPEDGPDDAVRERLWLADGILLPGGGDLAARWSGQAEHRNQYDVDETQDAFDLAVARVALAGRIPLLGVCRGAQVVNVARGGDLVQDLAETLGADHRHVLHAVTADPDLFGADQLTVSCYHHQGIGRLGAGLRAAAHAADGTIEAIAPTGPGGWFLGVQWHPEDTAATDPRQAGLFRALVAAARRHRKSANARPAEAPADTVGSVMS